MKTSICAGCGNPSWETMMLFQGQIYHPICHYAVTRQAEADRISNDHKAIANEKNPVHIMRDGNKFH